MRRRGFLQYGGASVVKRESGKDENTMLNMAIPTQLSRKLRLSVSVSGFNRYCSGVRSPVTI